MQARHARPTEAGTTFSVLYVCTGNICRSPMAERLLAARLPEGSVVDVVSAGTHAVVGHAMDPPAARVTRALGADPHRHVAQQLDKRLIETASLVLTATLAHRADVLARVSGALHRTFTMREFARLGADLPVFDVPASADQLRERVRQISGRRGEFGPLPSGEADIADPFGAAMSVMRTCGEQVSASVDAALRALGLTSPQQV